MAAPLMAPMTGALVWPHLRRPCIPLVYLDLNHIIAMGRVLTQHPKAERRYERLFQCASQAANEGRAIFPLSDSHVWEINKIADPRQRGDLVEVVARLSGFQYLLCGVVMARLELEAGIAALLREPVRPPIPLVRPTMGHAFGVVGGLKFTDRDGNDVTDRTTKEMGEARTAQLNVEFERQALRGPLDDELPRLRQEFGYRPERAIESHESRVGYERETARLLDENGEWRRGRLRDFISAREFIHEWLDLYTQIKLERLEQGRPAFEPSDSDSRQLMGGLPHVQVAISMKTRFHQNPRHVWTSNHLTDIDALSLAVPYCDAVLTDREARNAVQMSRELRSLGTFIPTGPTELADWLDDRPTVDDPAALVRHPVFPARQ